jgi:gluconate 5-dehydrogenase
VCWSHDEPVRSERPGRLGHGLQPRDRVRACQGFASSRCPGGDPRTRRRAGHHLGSQFGDETGGQTRVSTFNVTNLAAVDRGIAAIEDDWGTPDILVNNAGLQRRKPFVEFSLDDWNDLVATNLTSAFLVGQRVARGMVARGSGKIINIGSVQSQLARPGIAPYSATKGGIVMLTKGLCADLGPSGVQTNALAPGYFETELTRALVEDEEFSAWVKGRTPAGRWGKVEDLIGALVFLASPASDFVNGQVLFVDGGMTAVV